MSLAHYIIFHPDWQRDTVSVSATALIEGRILRNWRGSVHVDMIDNGNEDPYVFHEPWLYSYCHASQLRRSQSTANHLDVGSWLFFVSGDQANREHLAFDTVFRIGAIQSWRSTPSEVRLPTVYQFLRRSPEHPLYLRHFKWPIEEKTHTRVSHTYEADLWESRKVHYSFLPLDEQLQKATLHFRSLDSMLARKIQTNVHGKRPVRLEQEEADVLLTCLERIVKVKVVGDIRMLSDRDNRRIKKTC